MVFDSLGVGELPDAAEFGDTGSNTLGNMAKEVGGLALPVLESLGLGNIIEVKGVPAVEYPIASFGKMAEVSCGKDTTVGLWEMTGVITERPFPTFPNGFPEDLIKEFENAIGTKTIGNITASGTEIIDKLGAEHMKTGYPIVYTSADSVFQIAAHTDVVPIERLYDMCLKARALLTGKYGVDRVIARPFIGNSGAFVRTSQRHDFGLPPSRPTLFDFAMTRGIDVHAVGKVTDVFTGRGIAKSYKTAGNDEVISAVRDLLRSDTEGIIAAILGDFDSLWGHRNDVPGYAAGLEKADGRMTEILDALRHDDVLILTADHGCDPTTPSTDHSREYVPLLVFGHSLKNGVALGTRKTFADLGKSVADFTGIETDMPGTSFYPLIKGMS